MTIELWVYSADFMDDQLKKITRRESAGSGYGFGQRDISFEYSNIKTAMAHARKIKHLDGVDCVELRVEV